jgi:molybdate transport system ATP-binding protein
VTRELRSFTLHVELDVDGVLAVVGPSGAGKSTLLRLIAGLDAPSRGRIECDGDLWFGDGRDLPPERRRCGFVFQDYALFPHMTVRQNVAYGADGTDIDPLLDRVGIGHLAAARPPRLSGGERQRVALARALALQPQALLLDEPLSALDPATRGAVAAELAAVLRDAAVPAIVVTHAYDEAVSLAGRVAVIERGRVVQEGTPRELLEAPLSSFVAEFAGTNYLPGMASGGLVHLDRGGSVRIAGDAAGRVAGRRLGPEPHRRGDRAGGADGKPGARHHRRHRRRDHARVGGAAGAAAGGAGDRLVEGHQHQDPRHRIGSRGCGS